MRRRTRVLLVAGVLLALGAVVAVAPVLLAHLATDRLSRALGMPLSVRALAWNPFSGRWIATGLRIAGNGNMTAVRARRLEARVFLSDLLRGESRVRELVLDRPRVRLRAVPGGWELPAGVAGPTAPGVPSWPNLWIDHAETRRGVLRLLGLPARDAILRIDRGRFTGGSGADGVLARARLTGRLEASPFSVRGAATVAPASRRLRVVVDTQRMALARLLALVPVKTAPGVNGRLTLHARYGDAWHGDHRHRSVVGRAGATDVVVAEPRLRVARLAVSSFRLDPDRRTLALARVEADGGEATVHDGESGFPGPPGPDSPGTSWTVTMAELLLRHAVVHALAGGEERARATIAEARAGPMGAPASPVPFSLSAEVDSGGHVVATGTVVREPLQAHGHIRLDELALPALAPLAGLPFGLESGSASGDLELELSAAETRAGGRIELLDVKTLSPRPERPEHVLACKRIGIVLDTLQLRPVRAAVTRIELEWPYVFIDRTAEGVFPLSLASADETRPPQAAATVRVEAFTVTGGRVDFRDETLAPPYWRSLAGIAARAEGTTLTPFRVARVSLKGLVDELSPLLVEGTVGAQTRLHAEVEQLALPPFNPYLSSVSSYAVSSGAAHVTSDIVVDRTTLEVTNEVVLSRLGVQGGGGDDLLQRQVGVPLTLAIALMKDYRGNIALVLPVGGDLAAPKFSLRSAIMQGIVQAVRGALLSPLNALGRVFLRDGRIERFEIDPVPFPPGSRDLDRAGEERLAQVARVLQTRPELSLRIRGVVGSPDVERIQEIAALEVLAPDPGADDLRVALRARIAGTPGPSLDAHDRDRLDAVIRSLPWPADTLHALAADRGNMTTTTLVVEHRVPAGRVMVVPPATPGAGEPLPDAPGAALELGER